MEPWRQSINLELINQNNLVQAFGSYDKMLLLPAGDTNECSYLRLFVLKKYYRLCQKQSKIVLLQKCIHLQRQPSPDMSGVATAVLDSIH